MNWSSRCSSLMTAIAWDWTNTTFMYGALRHGSLSGRSLRASSIAERSLSAHTTRLVVRRDLRPSWREGKGEAMTAQAQHKLTWSLGRLSAIFQASIAEMKGGEYYILFKEGHKHIAKTVDISIVDDCFPVENYITPQF